jgi:hypothetical protein
VAGRNHFVKVVVDFSSLVVLLCGIEIETCKFLDQQLRLTKQKPRRERPDFQVQQPIGHEEERAWMT